MGKTRWIVTPAYVLGSDTFNVYEETYEEAVAAAKAKITEENWDSPNGWDIFQEHQRFEVG